MAVISEYMFLSRVFEKLPLATLKLVDTIEVFHRNLERNEATGLRVPFVCTAVAEKAALARADVLIAIQKNDAQHLRQLLPEKRVITVSHSYVSPVRRAASPTPGVVLYVGSPNPFNRQGLEQFLLHAWPQILGAIPEAAFHVVGQFSDLDCADHPRVFFLGRVSDEQLAVEYQEAHVVVNPQVAGTGLKIKCAEALSAGCPVVMNAAGADGLEDGAGTAFLLAHDWCEFAAHVVLLLNDEVVRRQVEQAAVQFAAHMFSSTSVFEELDTVLRYHRDGGHRSGDPILL
jgi:glycosyltransferase involved in cell wall biosynthesis